VGAVHSLEVSKDKLTFDALFKRNELAKAFSLDSDMVRRDARRVKQRLHESNRFLLNAESKMMQIWDLLTVLALMFTLLVSVYEIGFLDGLEGGGYAALFWVNQAVTMLFAIDLILNFFRPYRDALEQKVKSHRMIARNYIGSWFAIDLLSTIPFDVIAKLVETGSEVSAESLFAAGSNATILRLIRLMRLIKLARIMRASRVFARWADRLEHYISISHATRTLLWWIFILLTAIHWFCCAWG
jgi:hypothetical protein